MSVLCVLFKSYLGYHRHCGVSANWVYISVHDIDRHLTIVNDHLYSRVNRYRPYLQTQRQQRPKYYLCGAVPPTV